LILLGGAAIAAAEAPVVVPPPTPAEAILTPGHGMAVCQQHAMGVQLQFGRPTGVRVQYAVYQGGEFSVLGEVFGGARAAFWGDETVVGVGGRAMFNLTSDGVKNALVMSPGVGVTYWQARPHDDYVPAPYRDPYGGYYVPTPPRPQTDRYFLTLDTNIGWLHDLSPDLGWEVGLNFGVRVGLSGEEEGGGTISGKVSGGTIGVYTGLRY